MVDAPPTRRLTWRYRLVIGSLVTVWCVLAARLVQIQLVQRAQFAVRAARQQSFDEVIPARPGDILDRNGRLLATTTQTQSLYVDPSRIEIDWDLALMLGRALGLDPDRLYERLWLSQDRQFLWIKRRLSDSETELVRGLDLPRGAWGFRPEFQRQYPQGRLAAHVLGLRDIDGVGRGGIEQGLDELLRGRDGQRKLLRDARGYVLEVADAGTVPPEQGQTVRLTIDSVIQVYAEHRLDALMLEDRPVSACAIVLDPMTGDVLALASRPDFDPNRPDHVPPAAWTNQAIAAAYEPGSTFKPFVVAQALEQGVIVRDEEFDCEHGDYRMGGRVLHDHHPYGRLTVTDILVKSSNIGMAKIGERLTNLRLHAAATAFGFGRCTGIELPGEVPGLVRPLSEWNGYSTGSVPMGQELAATPLQVIAAHAILANHGRQISPHLLLATDDGPARARSVVASQVVSPETAMWLVQGPLVDVVQRGTGQKARIEGVRVFGKSGTAQKFDPASGRYSATRHVSSFVCGAPADDPRLLVLVSVNEPTAGSYFGGTLAAPAAADILQHALRYQDIALPLADRPVDEATARRE
jgi:cell division protein FtsI/penicillin-binding protein 2